MRVCAIASFGADFRPRSVNTSNSNLIIGAGLTGLSCAYHLDGDYLLLEKEATPGGIVRTRVRQGGFYCDGTGHWLHLRDDDMKALVNGVLNDGLVTYERRAVVYTHGVFTPYPFQANTYGLPREVVMECLLGLLKAKHPEDFGESAETPPMNSFLDCIRNYFGEGICRHFMIPYNEKLLCVKLDELSPRYAERFIPRPGVEDVVKGALGFSRESLGYNASFVYPKTGGMGALSQALCDALPERPRFETEVESVDISGKRIRLKGGETLAYENLVNTMPLPAFLSLCDGLSKTVIEAASKLRATTVYYFDIGVRGRGGPASNYHWVYCPDPAFIFYRVGSYSAVHKDAAPEDCRSYYAEMSGLSPEQLADVEGLKAKVLEGLKRLGIIDPGKDDILFMELSSIPEAYVLFDRNYQESREIVLGFLEGNAIQSKGRWGGWNYGGMEDAMLEGREAARKILQEPVNVSDQ